MKKQKDHKQQKRDAFMSFLEAPTTPASEIVETQKANNSDNEDCYEEFVEDTNTCNVCGKDVDATKKKKCGYCNLEACPDHLRKRRKRKNKWERICDYCQDRVLYEIYMKLEAKAEEALSIEEEITLLKHDNFFKQVDERRIKRREMAFRELQVNQKYESQIKSIKDKERQLRDIQKVVQNQEISVNQLKAFIQRVSAAFKQNCEENFSILTEQNARLAKQLAKQQKKCNQIKISIEKKEKQIEEAYEKWQEKQFKEQIQKSQNQPPPKPKDSCQIY